MKKIIIAVLLLLSWPVSHVSAMDKNEILQVIDRNLNPSSYEMYRKLINIEPDGSKKEFVIYMVKKGNDRVASMFLAPESEKGRTTLRLDENMWLYIPSVGKPLRITSLQSVVGGVFNNSDIMRLDYNDEYDVVQVSDEKEHHILELKAKSNTVAYDKLIMTVKKDILLPVRIECYAASGMLLKTLYFKKIKDFGNGIVRPSVVETDSPLYKDYKSVMIFAKIREKELADEVFTLNSISKIGELR